MNATRRRSPPSRDGLAIAYLNVMMEEADQDELVAALTRIARLRGGARLVEKVELSGAALYRALCMRGNPELKSAATLLKAMGIRLTMQPMDAPGRGQAAGGTELAELFPYSA